MVLAYYKAENNPAAVVIPETKLNAVDELISRHKGIKIGGKHYQDDQIIGLFEEQEWENLRSTLLKPEPKTWDEMREQDWYKKGKRR